MKRLLPPQRIRSWPDRGLPCRLSQPQDQPGGRDLYKDETGATPILHCVKKAEQKLLTDEKTKNYLGIEGNIEYGRIVQQLLFGRDSALMTSGRAKTAQAPGGTGALRIAAEFVVRNGLAKTVWISRSHLGQPRQRVPGGRSDRQVVQVLRCRDQGLDFAAMQTSLSEAQAGDPCCCTAAATTRPA